jgi:hypothetical protein
VGRIIELTVISQNNTQLSIHLDAAAGQEQLEMEMAENT